MSTVVQFLEALATNPKLQSAEDLAEALARTELEPAARQALQNGDVTALNETLGASGTVLCFIVPAENDDPEEKEEPQEGEELPDESSSVRAA